MSMLGSVSDMIDKYGDNVTVIKNNTKILTKGFVQPLRYKTNPHNNTDMTIGGFDDNKYYLYIGKPEYDFARTDDIKLICNNKQYVVNDSEIYYLSNTAVYQWAIITPYSSLREDDYDSDSEDHR